MNEIVCEGCGQYESECQCYGEKVTMNKEVRDFIDDEVYSSLLSLVEHDRCPTKLELDRFIKSLGYHLIKPENLTVQNEKYDRLTYLDEATEITKDGRPKVDELVLSNATVHLESLSDQCFMLIADNHKHRWHLSICTDSNRSKLHAVVMGEENKASTQRGS